jgi:hypothetical protein
MINFEPERWQLFRTGGRIGLLSGIVFLRFMWFALPVLITFLLALWYNRKARDLASPGAVLGAFIPFVPMSSIAKNPPPAKTYRPLEECPSSQRNSRSRNRSWNACLAPSSEPLVKEAQLIEERHAQGLLDLNRECQRFSATFQGTLADDTVRLAREAGVSEKAAFLALMHMFE